MIRPLTLVVLVSLTLTIAATGCDGGADEPAMSSAAGAVSAVPGGLMLSAEPEGARTVSQLRAEAGEGEPVVVRGVIAGRAEPFAQNRAIFTLLDPSVQTCDKNPTDACATPWDACCEPPDRIAANSATVQVAGDDGRPLAVGLDGVGGLAPLKQVVVTGTYRPSPDGNAAVVDATGLYVVQ